MEWNCEYNQKTYTYQVYMLRVDTKPENQTRLEDYVKTLGCSFYILSSENGKETEKPHQQGALLFNNKLQSNVKTKIRNYLNTQKWVTQGKNKVAFTAARKSKSLLKYSNDKEGKGMVTNMGIHMLNQIGTWKNKELDKKLLKDKIIEEYVKQRKQNERPLYKIELIQIAVKLAMEQERKPPPIKSLYFYAQLAKAITPQQVAEYSYGYEYQSARQEAEQYLQHHPSMQNEVYLDDIETDEEG